MAARATVRHIEQAHEDVAGAAATTETRVDEHADQAGKRRGGRRQRREDDEASDEAGANREEGTLLDIKV